MTKGLLARMSLLVLTCAAVSTAAPFSLGLLTLNDVGSAHADPLDDFVEFRLTNWNGLGIGSFSNNITFQNVSLEITWADGIAPPGIIGPLDWYLDGDENHLNKIDPANLPPSLASYESTRFTKRYGIEQGVFTMDLNPETDWTEQGGGPFSPEKSTYELVFWLNPSASRSTLLPAWDLDVVGNPTPEPSTYLMGGVGALVMLIGRRCRRSA